MGLKFPSAEDYRNHWFMIPINMRLLSHMDSTKAWGNLTVDYQFVVVANSAIAVPSDGTTSI